jgi:acetyl-CoA C-acetyltransferase
MSDNLPILVGCAQSTQRFATEYAISPLDMMLGVSQRAAEDTGLSVNILKQIDTMVVSQLLLDFMVSTDTTGMREVFKQSVGRYTNLPKSVANAFGAKPAHYIYSQFGGNEIQKLVNTIGERISTGECDITLITGAENLGIMAAAMKKGIKFNWSDDPGDKLTYAAQDKREYLKEHEEKYGLSEPTDVYAMLENAIRANRGSSIEEHQKFLGNLMSPFTRRAAENQNSWFPIERSSEELTTVTDKNRMVSFPYPKYLNAVMNVDMGAAVLMMSVGKAKKLGIDPSRWIYLNGCGDANEKMYITDRVNYYSSPALRIAGKEALSMAKLSIDDIDYFDLYSCFPSVVQLACEELGIAFDHPGGLTQTGGLAYFGGPGNNYVLHSIAEMMNKLRDNPGDKGLVHGNGGVSTKHSIGIYSTEPSDNDNWQRKDPALYQAEIDAEESPEFTETPEGPAEIETYTVTNGRKGPKSAIIIARLENGTRCLAKTETDIDLLKDMMSREYVGEKVINSQKDGINIFKPA